MRMARSVKIVNLQSVAWLRGYAVVSVMGRLGCQSFGRMVHHLSTGILKTRTASRAPQMGASQKIQCPVHNPLMIAGPKDLAGLVLVPDRGPSA